MLEQKNLKTEVKKQRIVFILIFILFAVNVNADCPDYPNTVFCDDFEYEVGREDLNARELFVGRGWSHAKIQQSASGARGYIYTVDTIPGYQGSFPGMNSNNVLAIEAKPNTLQGQTDFYLQLGSGNGAVGQIPANHWYQFWVYAQNYGNQQSRFTQGKFLYPNRATNYPATVSNQGYVYIVGADKRSKTPLEISPCGVEDNIGCPNAFFGTGWNAEAGDVNNHVDYNQNKLHANLAENFHLQDNTWVLVKIHIDLSGNDPRTPAGQGVYEQWIRPLGGSWLKTSEYLGGVTQVNGQTLQFIPPYTDGFRMLRMPTTVGATTSAKGDWFDYWVYMDDFTIAASESDLPVYGTVSPQCSDDRDNDNDGDVDLNASGCVLPFPF